MDEEFRVQLEARSRHFGRRLAQRRKERGFTLEGLSALTGISVGYLNNLEKAFQHRASPTVASDEKLMRIAKALEVSFIEVNSWLGRAPEYFDEEFWNGIKDAGYHISVATENKLRILNCIKTTLTGGDQESGGSQKAGQAAVPEARPDTDKMAVTTSTRNRLQPGFSSSSRVDSSSSVDSWPHRTYKDLKDELKTQLFDELKVEITAELKAHVMQVIRGEIEGAVQLQEILRGLEKDGL